MYRNNHGFTLIEIVTVLVLMSIIATGVLVASMNTDQIDLTAQVAKIRNHIRYAQAMALKRSDKNWGIKCDGSTAYWFFEGTNPDDGASQLPLPGEKNSKILSICICAERTTKSIISTIKESAILSVLPVESLLLSFRCVRS